MPASKYATPQWAWLRRLQLTPARAVRTIAAVTLLVTVISGAAMHVVDRREFPTIGRGLWWAMQTVTTVGYGDAVPHATPGRVVAIVVMLSAITFITVVTAAVTAILIDRSGGMPAGDSNSPEDLLVEISRRLARLERALGSGGFADATGQGRTQHELQREHEPMIRRSS
jgi:voltage-gated potassium channel